jgi:tetratricopeptide (TPR) repeat protein
MSHLKKRVWGIVGVVVGVAFQCSTLLAAIPVNTHSDSARVYVLQGKQAWQTGYIRESIAQYEKALSHDSLLIRAHIRLADLYHTCQELERAARHLTMAESLLARGTDTDRLLYAIEHASFGQNPEIARRAMESLLQHYPDDPDVQVLYAHLLTETNQIYKAIDIYTRLIENNPSRAFVHYQLGRAYQSIGQFGRAFDAFERYQDLSPGAPAPYSAMGDLRAKQNRIEESLHFHRKALSKDPEWLPSLMGITLDQVLQDEARQAINRLSQHSARTRDPWKHRTLQYGLVFCHIVSGNLQQSLSLAQTLVEKHLEHNRTGWWLWDTLLLGDIYREIGDHTRALEVYRAALERLNTIDLSDSFIRSFAYTIIRKQFYLALDMGRPDLARALAEQSLSEPPARLSNEFHGVLYWYTKEYKDAIPLLHQADLKNPRLLCILADAYHRAGQTAQAYNLWTVAATFNELDIQFAFATRDLKQMMTSAGYVNRDMFKVR